MTEKCKQGAPGFGPYDSEFEIHQESSTAIGWTDPEAYDQPPLRISAPLTSTIPEPERVQKQIQNRPFTLTSAELGQNYWNVQQKSNGMKQPENVEGVAPVNCQRLSTEEVMRVAGMRFIKLKGQSQSFFSVLTHTSSQPFLGLSEGDLKEVELAQLLLDAADNVANQQFHRASGLLSCCEMLTSKRASPVQRVVLYFAEALHERIDEATGGHKAERLIARTEPCFTTNVKLLDEATGGHKAERLTARTEPCFTTNFKLLKFHTLLPSSQITQFAAIQALVDNTATARRIHVIDLALNNEIHLVVLMQALLERKTEVIELLKVTVVATSERDKVEESGRRLSNVAESMGLNFSFDVIFVNDINDVTGDSFNIEDGEAVAVYAWMALMDMISHQYSLETLTSVIRNLNPLVMVVTELEANHNAPSFVTRFIEALFFYSAIFDCLDTCQAYEDENKMLVEQNLGNCIKNVLSTDSHERTKWRVKIDVWRTFFTRYGMVEVGLSESALYQARLVTMQHPSGRFCTLEHDGKCFLVGWKGTPLLSLSVWKFR